MKLSKSNLNKFLEYYHFFHDSYITSINYLINDNKIEMYLDLSLANVGTELLPQLKFGIKMN